MHHSGQVKINVLGGISVCAELLLSKGVTELISSKDIGNDRSKHLSPDPSLIIRLAAEFPPSTAQAGIQARSEKLAVIASYILQSTSS